MGAEERSLRQQLVPFRRNRAAQWLAPAEAFDLLHHRHSLPLVGVAAVAGGVGRDDHDVGGEGLR